MSPFAEFNRVNETRYGRMIYNANDTYIGRAIQLYGEFSYGEVVLFEQIVRTGSVVLEVGANIGAHTLFFAQQTGPTGEVFAFEPQRIVFQTLCGNMALNSITNVQCFHAAAGSKSGEIVVPRLDYRNENNFGGLRLGSQTPGELVPLMTIDSLSLSRCDFIKIDVEGMEESVLRGAKETIARFQPPLYVEWDRNETALLEFIDSLNYDIFLHWPPLFNPENFAGNSSNVFVDIVSKNVLCVARGLDHSINGLKQIQVGESCRSNESFISK